ncbi:MAG: magnesium transporter CorA family protein [Actinobacteria bacterium]|nr:magnesium transporter CorA family protein [Actinomycetota bacterium]
MVRSRVYRQGAVEAWDVEVEAVSEHLAHDGCVVWIDLVGDEIDRCLDVLADELGLHELAVEDALDPHHRPQLGHFIDHLLLTCPAARIDVGSGDLQVLPMTAFIGDRWLITVHPDGAGIIDRMLERWDASPELAVHGVSFLVYGLLDVVVDSYFDTVSAFDDFYDEISDAIFAERPIDPDRQAHWFQMRRALFRFHRIAVPMREAVSSLMRRERGSVAEELYPYYQDVYDHVLRVSEATDGLRDLVATIVETNLSLRDYRQNQIMKKVTSWAAIIAVPTLVTGYYGMNVPYPGFAHRAGMWWATGLIVVLSAALYTTFRRKDWL